MKHGTNCFAANLLVWLPIWRWKMSRPRTNVKYIDTRTLNQNPKHGNTLDSTGPSIKSTLNMTIAIFGRTCSNWQIKIHKTISIVRHVVLFYFDQQILNDDAIYSVSDVMWCFISDNLYSMYWREILFTHICISLIKWVYQIQYWMNFKDKNKRNSLVTTAQLDLIINIHCTWNLPICVITYITGILLTVTLSNQFTHLCAKCAAVQGQMLWLFSQNSQWVVLVMQTICTAALQNIVCRKNAQILCIYYQKQRQQYFTDLFDNWSKNSFRFYRLIDYENFSDYATLNCYI